MQIQRPTNLQFPSAAPVASPSRIAPSGTPPVITDTVSPVEKGVKYTGSTDLKSMTLENQLEYGRDQGVFTKISLHKEGVLVMNPAQARGDADTGFVASAVTTMKDFEEGLAALKAHAPASDSTTLGFLAGKFKGLQNAASKLNVFA
jgi:hypothetical protein